MSKAATPNLARTSTAKPDGPLPMVAGFCLRLGTSRPASALFAIETMEVTVRKLIFASVLAFATTAAVTSPTQAQFLFSPFGGYYGGFGSFGRPLYRPYYYDDPYYAVPYRPFYRYHHRHYYRYYHRHYHHRHHRHHRHHYRY
ncbi:hypothetical protein [Mesorhizobium sp. M1406]|uniref:hypothetical protein n=1 Tax=Mesorhizobium sp. M1406 TaxID=2957099 RepID=UPI00333AD148